MILVILPFFPICFVLLKALYNVYFHPLHKIPGPPLWIAFPVFRHLSALRGNIDRDILQFHERYGEALRYSDNEVSIITAQAWQDIYGHGRSLQKYNTREKDSPPDIVFSSVPDHSRFRRVLSHAFSEKGLRAQEPLIKEYVEQLLSSLREEAHKGVPVDMTMWYNLTTFDIISDLSFGKTFGCLQSRNYNEYTRAIFDFIQLGPFIRVRNTYTALWDWTGGLVYNKIVLAGRSKLRSLSKTAAMSRVYEEKKRDRVDFMDSMLRHRGLENGLSDAEIAANANILFIAGSETTATLLSGITYWLTQSPYALRRVTEEVRAAFEREEDITFQAASQKLPYMLACLEEAFRLYPPVPLSLQRVTDQTTDISGYRIPPRTSQNWHRPKDFIPERWLPESRNDTSSPFYHDNRAVLQPFSVGPRNCIGRNLAYNEMRLILAKVLWSFDISSAGPNKSWVEDQKTMILWVKAPLWCKLTPRENKTNQQEKEGGQVE